MSYRRLLLWVRFDLRRNPSTRPRCSQLIFQLQREYPVILDHAPLRLQDLDQLCHAIKQPSDGLATAVCNVVQPQYHGLEGGEALLGSKHSLMNTAASNTTMLQDYFNSGEISSAKVVLPSRQKDALQVQDKARVCGTEKAMCGRVCVGGWLCLYTQACVHTSIRACTHAEIQTERPQRTQISTQNTHSTSTRARTSTTDKRGARAPQGARSMQCPGTARGLLGRAVASSAELRAHPHEHPVSVCLHRYRRLYVSMCSELPHLHFYDRNHITFRWQQLGAVSLDLRPINVSVL